MKSKKTHILLSLLLLFPAFCVAGNIYSFEETTVPSVFSATNGSLSISSAKKKLADKALRWDWSANSILTATDPANLAASSQINDGGITVWIYNTKASDQYLAFEFYDASGTKQCSKNFKLNYEGWRCFWAIFRYDMGFNKQTSTLKNMKIVAPSSGNGTFYVDFLEFANSVSWERISDFQYDLNQTNYNIISFLDIRNTSAPSAIQPDADEASAVSAIEQRLNDWYLGTGKYAANQNYKARQTAMSSYINSAKNKISSLNLTKETDGTVSGEGLYSVNYQGATVDGVNVTTFRNISETYLIQLAYDYRITGNQTSLDTALDIFDWYYNQGWADGSALGSLRFEMLRSSGFYHSAFLLKNDLGTDERYNHVNDAIRWYSMFGSAYSTPETPGELADYIRTLAMPKLFYALSIKDAAERNTALHSYQKFIKNALSKAPGFKGTMKPDYSGYHHNGAYYSAYYPDALYAGCLIYYLLHDTPYALGEDTYNDLKEALLTFRFLCGEYNVPAATTGRFPTQQTIMHQILPAMAYLGLSKTTPDAQLLSAFKRLWKPTEQPMSAYIKKVRTDICFSSSLGEVELLLDFDALGGTAEANPSGTRYMPYSGLLIARQPAWMITAKGFSKYIWDYESSTSENIYGRYQSYGQLEYTDLENGYSSYNPSNADWNWNHIPGTTSKFLSYANLDFNKTNGKHRNLSDKTFLGGIALDNNHAMFANQVHDNAIDKSFYADKSVFVFDNLVYCLGSGINILSTTTSVYTTLFQNVLGTGYNTVYVNDQEYSSDLTNLENPVIKDNYGNVFIVEDGSVTVKKNNSCMLAYIDHGKVITDKHYAYAWLIKPDAQQISSYKTESPISVLSQNATAHAVYNKDKKVLGVSVFLSGNPIDVRQLYSVSKPMMVMIGENADTSLDIAFSDPDMKRESAARGDDITPSVTIQPGESAEISLVINGTYEKTGGDTAVTIEVSGGKTIVKYPSAREGQTHRVKLSSTISSIHENNSDNTGFYITSKDNDIVITSDNNEAFSFTVSDLSGRKLFTKTENHQSAVVSKSNFPTGLLIINVSDTNHKKNFKQVNNN